MAVLRQRSQLTVMSHRAILLALANVVVAGTTLVDRSPEEDQRSSDLLEKDSASGYGYQDGEVTQGVGYGHHLHPFYYQGKMVKFYDCAKEDDWRPYATDDQQGKKQKAGPVKKYDPNAEKAKNRRPQKPIQQRRDVPGTHRRKLEMDHAKFVMDINAMSDDRHSLHRGKLLMDSDSIDDRPIRVAEPDEIALLDDVTYPSGTRRPKQEPKFQNRHRFRTVPFDGMPFQRYKKFKVVTVQPASTVHYKYVKLPLKTFGEGALKQESHPYPFVSAVEAFQKTGELPPPFRKGRNVPSNVVVPQLTMLEQFLLLFPKLI